MPIIWTEERLPTGSFIRKCGTGVLPDSAVIPNCLRFMEPFLKEGKDVLYLAFPPAVGTNQNGTLSALDLREKYPYRKIFWWIPLAPRWAMGGL